MATASDPVLHPALQPEAATPALAVNIETDGGVLIGKACSEIWDAKDEMHLNALSSIIFDQYALLMTDVADTSMATKDAYEVALMNYATAYDRLTDSILSRAIETGDAALKAAVEPRSAPESSVLDKLVRAAINAGDTAIKGSDLAVTDGADSQLVAAQRAAEQELFRTGKAYLREEARAAALNLLLDGIMACYADQQNYLRGGQPPKKD